MKNLFLIADSTVDMSQGDYYSIEERNQKREGINLIMSFEYKIKNTISERRREQQRREERRRNRNRKSKEKSYFVSDCARRKVDVVGMIMIIFMFLHL